MRTRADLTTMPGFSGLSLDTCGNPCVWRNHYYCSWCRDGVDTEWAEDWSCQCDDECPECGGPNAPYDSIWLGPAAADLRALWERLPESEGPA